MQADITQQLGLPDTASTEEITQALAAKKAQLQHSLATAPSEALRSKFEQALAALNAMEVPADAAKADATRSPLSHTKMADLPQSGTRFDADHSASINLSAGAILANRYRIIEQIGVGGMGTVFAATDSTTGKEVALKVMQPALLTNERARERFLNEARISQQLSHPNIVNVYDVQQDQGFYFLVMERLHGQDLRQQIEHRKLTREPYTLGEVQSLAKTLSAALSYAHKHTIHRDIKPENIWVSDDGDYKLMDFGIAQMQSTSQRTKTGAAMGTAYYMAPEQLKGLKDIDGRADQYALAVMVYELLSGEIPAGRIEPLHKLCKGVPKKISAVVDKALSAKAEERYSHIDTFAHALTAQPSLTFPALPWAKIGIATTAVAAVGVVMVLGTGQINLSSLKELLPLSQEEVSQRKAELAKLEGQIKSTKDKLEKSRRNLENDVRDAERNKTAELAHLTHWQSLTEEALFSGSQITELEGDLESAKSLTRDGSYTAAKEGLNKVLQGYNTLLVEFAAAEKLDAAEHETARAERAWSERQQESQLGAPASATEAAQHKATAKSQQQESHFNQALTEWQGAITHYQQATEQAKTTYNLKQAALLAKADWVNFKKNYQFTDTPEAQSAEEAEQQALTQQTKGELIAAQSAWQTAKAHWQAAKQTKLSDAGGIDKQRAEQKAIANAIAEAERQKIAAAKVKAEEERIAKLIPAATPQMVSIPGRSFSMSKYEATFAQYDAYAEAAGISKPEDQGWGRGNRPVINVSWNDAVAYAKWLSVKTGKRFRLPTEQEWEHAARAGTTTDYPWGNSIGSNNANCIGCGSQWDSRKTAPVGSFRGNGFGLYDMHGNVWEWTSSCYDNSCGDRVLRGGSWGNYPDASRSAHRLWDTPTIRFYNIGFRLVQDN